MEKLKISWMQCYTDMLWLSLKLKVCGKAKGTAFDKDI